MFFLALASLAGPPSAIAPASEQQQAILHVSPVGPLRDIVSQQWEPSDFEEEDAKRHSSEQPIAWALTSAICGAALFIWRDAPPGQTSAEPQRFEIFLGLGRGPPARG